MTTAEAFRSGLRDMPVIAILRGVKPEEAGEIGDVVIDAGITVLEVPLNSPDPLESIARLTESCGERALVGCGTVLSETQLREAHDAGARLALHPHGDARLVEVAIELGMVSVPGVTSPTEAFAMVRAGASALKFFPTAIVSPASLAAMKEVLPAEVFTIAVGGISGENMGDFWAAGIDAFGVGSGLYRTGWRPERVRKEAQRIATIAADLSRSDARGFTA